jgi:uncharacterized protein YjbI with pentapeptide repeats
VSRADLTDAYLQEANPRWAKLFAADLQAANLFAAELQHRPVITAFLEQQPKDPQVRRALQALEERRGRDRL